MKVRGLRAKGVPLPVRHFVAVAVGVFLIASLFALLPAGVLTAYASYVKLTGQAPGCDWSHVLGLSADTTLKEQLLEEAAREVRLAEGDDAFGIVKIDTSERAFWVKESGERMPGVDLIAYLLGEHRWMRRFSSDLYVRPGDTVMDVGAHVGVFTHFALKSGAEMVVAVEPEPTNLECLRRNFAGEIAGGRLVIVPMGLWSSESSMELSLGVGNSGENSMVLDREGSRISVPVTTIDRLAVELALERLDFIKMDIEGAEREALAGGIETIRRFRPRLMLDTYHLPDDAAVLPAVLRAANPEYSLRCGPCEIVSEDGAALVPHVSYFQLPSHELTAAR